VKAHRSKKQRRTWQEIYKERTDTSYGPGIGLVASASKKKEHKNRLRKATPTLVSVEVRPTKGQPIGIVLYERERKLLQS
jgi:hypothetical protein